MTFVMEKKTLGFSKKSPTTPGFKAFFSGFVKGPRTPLILGEPYKLRIPSGKLT
jgi:hypothetical protein